MNDQPNAANELWDSSAKTLSLFLSMYYGRSGAKSPPKLADPNPIVGDLGTLEAVYFSWHREAEPKVEE